MDNMVWVYVSHRKAGVELLRHLAQEHVDFLNASSCMHYGDLGWAPAGCTEAPQVLGVRVWFFTTNLLMNKYEPVWGKQDYRILHITRDPLDMVVSGYIHHASGVGGAPPSLEKERSEPQKEGVAMEVEAVLNNSGADMLEVVQNRTSDRMLTVRFEDFVRSSKHFDLTAMKLYNFALGDGLGRTALVKLLASASKHDLRRHPDNHEPGNVARATGKARVKKAINRLPHSMLRRLNDLRMKLGY